MEHNFNWLLPKILNLLNTTIINNDDVLGRIFKNRIS